MRCEGFCGKTFEKDSEDNTSVAKVKMVWHNDKIGSQTANLCYECVDAVAKTLHPYYSYYLESIPQSKGIDWSVIQDGDRICIIAPGVTKIVRRDEIFGGNILNSVFGVNYYET